MILTITERKERRYAGRCSNMRCLVPLEPPFNELHFQVDGLNRIFKRDFCIDCVHALETADLNEIEFEVLECQD